MKKADNGKRIKAFLIDYIIYTIVLVASATIFLTIDNFDITFPIFMIIVFIAISFKDILNGRSIGKRILGLYVRDYNDFEKTPRFYNLIIRNLLLFIWPVEFLVLKIDKDSRRLGDKLAKTQVVENQLEVYNI